MQAAETNFLSYRLYSILEVAVCAWTYFHFPDRTRMPRLPLDLSSILQFLI
jgi:hypothetical protein